MDLEGYAKRALGKGEDETVLADTITERILEIKNTTKEYAEKLSQAVIVEAKATLEPIGDVFEPIRSGITLGEFGVGSRGLGDFYTHEKISEIIGKTTAVVDSSHLDDSGVVQGKGEYIVVNIDGIHSRLSDYPFLAGFHVARAALRDIYAMGARPLALLSDIHVADDGDVGKIFDHIAGITAVSDLTGVPLITGSTLRIGGDVVIGERMSGGVGAVGIANTLTSRIRAEPGDKIIMSEGAGGGTISTAALYYGKHEIVEETLNITFIKACELLMQHDLISQIHVMTDVTNGGVRGDAKEISRTAKVKLTFYEDEILPLVNQSVLRMLNELEIDYLGVSLDALLLITPPHAAEKIIQLLSKHNIQARIIGEVTAGSGTELITPDGITDFTPRFRESAYTPVKKILGERTPGNYQQMQNRIDDAAAKAIYKKQQMVNRIRKKQKQ
ncbi:MAG: hydrogenase expression/formation protein [Candidatus Argoarchaeum ethanivorans]|uniref:Hydrogenase expression/formation protein n=1 Tax=Candidatus Argoarchaeum ethanivorans TaxID=2608793 RepID=A0A8B3S5S5_9EURY|nr:MAG: hydrogenase expression/formation protein [Candidatus Argoarchaeum ethanivorans]